MKVLYEDNHIIAVYKPAGLLVQGDITGDESLMDWVKEYLKEKYKKPGNVFLGLVHRLDRNVSGIVLFGKTSKGASRLSEQLRNNEIIKIYQAIVEGRIKPDSGTLVHYLQKDENKKIAIVSDEPKDNYDMAELSYETVGTNQKHSLLRIQLKTGRFHQIRAQLSAIGYPIVGDKKYLPAGRQAAIRQVEHFKDGSIALCATEIEFKTATTGEKINIKIEYPQEWLGYLN